MTTLAEITEVLKAPFDPAEIDFLPKSPFEKDGKSFVIGMPFADPRAYQDRLNTVCPGEWSSQASVTVAGNKVILAVTVTICGVPHTDVGEATMGENTATEAHAQAFKRACSQAGLGRFLYALEKQYLPYDKVKKRISLSDNERKGLVRGMYWKAGLLPAEEARAPRSSGTQAQAQAQAVHQTPQQQPTESEPVPAPVPIGPVTEEQRRSIAKLCKAIGGKKVALPANALAAKELIAQLAGEYKACRAAG
ncbi:MAG: hypothetical protein ACRDHZ_00715 [Ktedonobacteraceae bacterium]